ncbi:MAG TPA: Gfo/Idh/MocA family oxidoreductase [Candidatus Latescibacteria bacterium]|nr:Gfo/Idh/MocA family oxidoreductase [Candidatus Latescibacterota bacterium]
MLRLAFLGMNEGNGHAFSWSAIINGRYDPEKMKRSGYPVIYEYLSARPPGELGIPGVEVTHIWTQDPGDARRVAETTFIPHVLSRPEEAVGEVDAVVITTDIGSTHLELARPFLERDIPVFIDKPLTDNEEDLKEFIKYFEDGKPLLSSSSMRYAKEIEELDRRRLGRILFVSAMMTKSWERYGIHALEGLYMIMGGGMESVQNLGTEDVNVVHIRYRDGRQAVVNVIYPSKIFGRYDIVGDKDSMSLTVSDAFYMFKRQLEAFVRFVRERSYPYPPDETVELTRAVVAGIISKRRGEEKVDLGEVAA